jgi:hypothetical protein
MFVAPFGEIVTNWESGVSKAHSRALHAVLRENRIMKYFRCTVFLIILCATPAFAQPDAQRANENPMSRALQRWWAIAGYIVRTADSMPADRYGFKPFVDVRSFGDQVGHIADAHFSYCSRARGESNPVTVQIEGNVTAKAALLAKLKESVAYCDAAYNASTDASLSEFWQQGNVRGVKLGPLVGNLAHDNEHSSTMIMLMRMSGIAPTSLDAPARIPEK